MIAAIESGRDLIVPDPHRAAALRLAWARHQRQLGREVWSTPRIHVWEDWLTQCWREAQQPVVAAATQLLSATQERALWEEVLGALSAGRPDEPSLTLHAAALMSAAARATQAELALAGTALSREEQLLPVALAEVRKACSERGLLSLRLAPAGSLAFVAQFPAPLICGQQRLTALQRTLAQRHWPGQSLLADAPAMPVPAPVLVRAADLEQELAACAAWCLRQMQRDAGARLLVICACGEPALGIQGEMLWRQLMVAGVDAEDATRRRWLAVQGGEPLLHQALIADALLALDLAGNQGEIETAQLLALLRSAYFDIGGARGACQLADWFGARALARYSRVALQSALQAAAKSIPAAPRLARFIGTLHEAGATRRQGTTAWAAQLTAALDDAGFARFAPLDSREQQRLARWHALLDEFASLDAVLPPLSLLDALSRLRRLARQARHGAASADAAITLTDELSDPVAGYDGIWVLGLAETRWPAAPRPDPWVALAEQRRAGWPEAGARERREQAQWALACWQRRGAELILSHPEREADVTHRPTPILPSDSVWNPPLAGEPYAPRHGRSQAATDQQLPPVATGPGVLELGGGSARLERQQDCPFRAQAEWRLGASAPATFFDGIPNILRGKLLHGLLQELWRELGDQARLLALDAAAEQAMLLRCWHSALHATLEAQWLSRPVLDRERGRALRTVARVLELERERAPFIVRERELSLRWQGAGASLGLRIDRIDQVGADFVVVDYKSGAVPGIALHRGELQPLQLALYAAALWQRGTPVSAAALLQLKPSGPAISGIVAKDGMLPGRVQQVEDWQPLQQQWQQSLLALLARHLSGEATLTRDRGNCRHCHLPALCRRAGADVAEAEAGVASGDE